MWRSKDDVIRDLAILNDFGVPEDNEPYKILYSIGRGNNTEKKLESREKFLDIRTGEVINELDEIPNTNDIFYQNKGRGSFLSSYSKTKLQLQQQLRLARPLGSGDGAIESYYKRNALAKNHTTSSSTSSSESDIQNTEILSKEPKENLVSNIKKAKATRNPNMYNVLITNLLSKVKTTTDANLTTENPHSSNIEKNNNRIKENINYNNNNDDDDDDGGGGGCDSSNSSSNQTSDSSFSSTFDLNKYKIQKLDENLTFIGEWKYVDQNCGTCRKCKETTFLEKNEIEGLKIIDDDEVNGENY